MLRKVCRKKLKKIETKLKKIVNFALITFEVKRRQTAEGMPRGKCFLLQFLNKGIASSGRAAEKIELRYSP